tara:strand:+ start:1492 stop:2238 length:747 start_codon:yes stop_codon:yes gene_type:complete
MAYTVATQTLVDTNSKAVVHVDGEGDGPDVSAVNIFDSSHSKYSLLTLTLSGAPTTNFCIGEVLTCDSQFLRVQDYTSGGTTVVVYRVTSASDVTPLAFAAGNNGPTTSEAIVGSVSGTSSVTTHGSTTGSFVQKSVSVTSVRWSVSTGHSAKLFYKGGTANQDICYLTGSGVWDSTNHFIPVGMGAAAGNSGSVLGDIQILTVGAASGDTLTVQVGIQKGAGYEQPLYAKNLSLGYNQGQHGFGDTY